MSDFFRFPHTPHIAWLGTGVPRDDKVLSAEEARQLLSGPVSIEEKIDGANLGISLGADGKLRVQNRGQYLSEPFKGQFSRLNAWLGQHGYTLADRLPIGHIVFGEWCAAKHSLNYSSLPDWFIVFDVYDCIQQRFWSVARRNELVDSLGLTSVHRLFFGDTTLVDVVDMIENAVSHYRLGPPEGLVIRRDIGGFCQARAKLVRAEFTQAIVDHWRSRTIEWNRVASDRDSR